MNYMERIPEFKENLCARLKPDRYVHSLNVADSALALAGHYGCDKDKAYIAGLLHDCTKNESVDRQLQMLSSCGIILSCVERNNPKLLHAMTAPIYAKAVFGIDDSEILDAIRYHTTGKKNMNLLQKIVYIADYISKERDYPDVDIMRLLAFEDLDKAALYSLKYSLRSLSDKERVIHPDSLEFYNELIIKKYEET